MTSPVKNVLIKVSGDLHDHPEFLSFTTTKAQSNYVVVICGGGTKISQALQEAGFDIKFDDQHGRITETWQERKIARDILETEAKKLEDKFVGKGIMVMAPILYAGSVICHINGDNLVKALYLGFDEIYVFTTKYRLEAKKKIFQQFPKVQLQGVAQIIE